MNNPNVPKLRFLGFDGEWEIEKFGKIATNKSGKFNPIKENSFTKCIELEHLETGTGQLLGFIDGSNSGSIKNKFNEGDVLFGKLRPYLKKYLQAPFEGVCSSEIWVLKGVKITNSFLYQIVQTNKFIDIANQSSGSKMPRADWNVIENCDFTFPTLPEQQKIASFLSAVDQKIQQLSRKKELLEQYKKGVMQQFFSGKLRFKDENGKDYADWEEKKLGDVCKKIQDGNYGASYPKADEFIETGIPFLTSKALGNGGSIISSKIDYISLEKHKELKKAHLKLNDVLFTNRGANVGAIGFVDESISLGNIGPQLTLLRTNQEIINSGFLFHSMNSFGVKKQVSSQDSGSAMNFFGIGVTSKFKIQVPSLPEQQKIANFLSGIDAKIEQVNGELVKTQEFKKGLLQQLFV
jgi:type I restriction enzyme S subunit